MLFLSYNSSQYLPFSKAPIPSRIPSLVEERLQHLLFYKMGDNSSNKLPVASTAGVNTLEVSSEKFTPPLECLAVTAKDAYIYQFNRNGVISNDPIILSDIKHAQWSPDGTQLAVVTMAEPHVVKLFDSHTRSLYRSLMNSLGEEKMILRLYFSPLGSVLIVLYESNRSITQQPHAVIGWEVKTGGKRFCASIRQTQSPQWPLLQWNPLETLCCRIMPDGIHIFEGCSSIEEHPPIHLPCKKAHTIAWAPQVDPLLNHLAVMIPKGKSTKGELLIYEFHMHCTSPFQCTEKKCFSQEFPDADEMEIFWSPTAMAVLLKIHSIVDRTGKSYYGTDSLYFLTVDGSIVTTLVDITNGPVHDVQWNPKRAEFLLCAGSMPPEIILYEGVKGTPKISFGSARRNTIRWNPFGRFFALGGFGNLVGDLNVWDKVTRKTIGSMKIPCSVVCEFAPDGRHLLSATTSPRLRVDNCIKVYRYTGEYLSRVDFTELLSVSWKPVPAGTYEDRGVSPKSTAAKVEEGKTVASPPSLSLSSSARTSLQTMMATARGGLLASRLRAERGATTTLKATKIDKFSNKLAKEGLGEAEIEENKSPRTKRKKKKSKELSIGNAADDVEEARDIETREGINEPPSMHPSSLRSLESEDDIRKRLRNLRKKIGEIERLQEKDALTLEQQTKINSASAILEEVSELEEKMKAFAFN
ncbi:putative eukaryotic initiation factor-2A [Cardiosporidium cionae]|uniref:Eukaryotic translation initiation factor 2A n=1 Tax=Cardiosporidium cionae TaxID=476202 RepID=A0ABQ7J7G3_9APIC|nr:putative eukaryotic initiation factor-2A [Cardiosporidium cionae]|eukprot:KAF8819921.1 putative eukaryotic initiation factor-2A [Cardiosporidium cionae]